MNKTESVTARGRRILDEVLSEGRWPQFEECYKLSKGNRPTFRNVFKAWVAEQVATLNALKQEQGRNLSTSHQQNDVKAELRMPSQTANQEAFLQGQVDALKNELDLSRTLLKEMPSQYSEQLEGLEKHLYRQIDKTKQLDQMLLQQEKDKIERLKGEIRLLQAEHNKRIESMQSHYMQILKEHGINAF